ncbi:hypothetical protein TARUN_7835 [Trichoderma arundinaceum]|uniref:Uncharacterized protein n=1 Tax=Trichoderma arundinaceum TaxID=490622 RepID=A0A395NE83_TRIAR|nr:hypothetical protein TARUN_7835 [Trichoderma arundinaceum]
MAAPAQRNRSPESGAAAPRQFKKHRVLPRPHNDQAHDGSRRMTQNSNLARGAPVPRSSTPHPVLSPQPLKHQLRRMGTGPDLPPTPPTHSNASSSSQSAVPSSPTSTENSVRLPNVVANRPPATPPDQRGPPTPDVTPPHPASLAKVPRPSIKDRMASGSTMGPESRAESFITAREEVTSSEDEAMRTPGWPPTASATSQATITRSANAHAANIDVERPTTPLDRTATKDAAPERGDHTPKAKAKSTEPVDRQASAPEAGHSRDARLSSAIMSHKTQYQRRPSGVSRPILHHGPVVEDNVSVAPTDATKAVRKMRLEEAAPVTSSSKRHEDQKPAKLVHPQVEATAKREARPLSTSSQSTSTVVEVLLVDGPPKRQRTLRHMRKQSTLRDATDTREDAGPVAHEANLHEAPKPRKVTQSPKLEPSDRESYISAVTHSTNRSISSRTARREIWKSGAIPVVIVPDRRSSRGPKSREPSLRSTSSRHSDKAKSIKSASASAPSPSANSGPVFERPARRSRAYSESDGSERTIDFPPTIPQRSSSLSAPTSRNGSRAGSVNASSVKVHSAAIEQQPNRHFSQEVRIICPSTPSLPAASPEMNDLEREETCDSLGVDQHDDVLSVRKIPLRNTPFSVASMETCATAPELVEALAVHMFPHQNSSVLMVDHSNRPSEAAATAAKRMSSPPKLMNSYERMPFTPPQKMLSSLEVDSPLRNPRAPPQPPKHPPAINFIPATPSGMTPAAERVILQGNYFESLKEKPPRRPSIVRRAFSRRRHSIDYVPSSRGAGFLARTFSLSRRNRDDSDISLYRDNDKPTEEDKLHPFWRPQWISDEDSEPMSDDEERGDDDDDDYEREDEVFRYPPVDNRPRRPTRSFSQKVKQTFTILPSQEYHVDDVYGPQRRTIRRTSSGNLRIVRRKVSSESIRQRLGRSRDPRSIVVAEPRKRFWRTRSVSRGGSMMGARRFSIGSTLEEIQNIPQMISDRRREKRSQRLRQMISGPKEVRDGVGEVIRRGNGAVQNGTARRF